MYKSMEVISCKPGDCFGLFNLQYSQTIVEGGEMDVSQKGTRRLEIIYRKLFEGVLL